MGQLQQKVSSQEQKLRTISTENSRLAGENSTLSAACAAFESIAAAQKENHAAENRQQTKLLKQARVEIRICVPPACVCLWCPVCAPRC